MAIDDNEHLLIYNQLVKAWEHGLQSEGHRLARQQLGRYLNGLNYLDDEPNIVYEVPDRFEMQKLNYPTVVTLVTATGKELPAKYIYLPNRQLGYYGIMKGFVYKWVAGKIYVEQTVFYSEENIPMYPKEIADTSQVHLYRIPDSSEI